MRPKTYGYHDRTGAVRKMPRKGIRIDRNAGKIAKTTNLAFFKHIACKGTEGG